MRANAPPIDSPTIVTSERFSSSMKSNDGLPEVGLVETRAWIYWRVSVAWEINGVHRVRSGEKGRKTAEIFELRPDRMYQEQRRPAADLLKTYT